MSIQDVSFEHGLRWHVEEAWNAMCSEDTKYRSTDMSCGEEGPAALRSRLPEQFRTASLTQIRTAWQTNNRNGKNAKGERSNKTNWVDRIRNAATQHRGISGHSDEYCDWIGSSQWAERARQHKRLCDYRCQLCGRFRNGADLEVHHIHYATMENEQTQDLLCLCGDGCHAVADAFRSRGRSIELPVCGDLFD